MHTRFAVIAAPVMYSDRAQLMRFRSTHYAVWIYVRQKEKVMKNKAILAVLLAISALAAGCNTVDGAGKDIERGGEKIQGAANR